MIKRSQTITALFHDATLRKAWRMGWGALKTEIAPAPFQNRAKFYRETYLELADWHVNTAFTPDHDVIAYFLGAHAFNAMDTKKVSAAFNEAVGKIDADIKSMDSQGVDFLRFSEASITVINVLADNMERDQIKTLGPVTTLSKDHSWQRDMRWRNMLADMVFPADYKPN